MRIKPYITKTEFIAWLESEEKFKKTIESGYEETPEMKAGNLIHELYENIDRYANIGGGELTFDKSRIPDRIVENEIVKNKGMVDNLFEIEKQRYRKIVESGKDPKEFYPPTIREEMMTSERLRFHGKPDAIYKNLKGGFTVVDLKSEFYSDHHKEELAFYRALIQETLNMNINEGVLIGVSDDLDRGNRVRSYNQKELDSVDIEKKVKNAIIDINQNPELPDYRERGV